MNPSLPFIRRPVMTLLLTASAILFGVLAYRKLPVNDLPSVDYPVIQVNCAYPGASPQTVANNIATPLERQFMQIPGLELITSKSTQGNVSLTLQFSLEKSIDAAATDVQTAITQATGSLPVDLPSPPTFSKTNPNDQAIMYIALTSDTVTAGRLYDIASTTVGQQISIINGVSRVQVFGSKSAIRIKADPSALAARNMTVDDLNASIRAGTTYQGAGQIDGPNRTLLLQPQGQLESADQYNGLIIGQKEGAPIYLRDVAAATDGVQDERVDMRFWTRGRTIPKATVVLAVFRQAGANAVEVSKAIRALAPKIDVQLPPSVSLIPIHDRSQSIVNSVRDVTATLYIAFILVVIVIYLFLGRATDTLIPIVALPLSLLITFVVMGILGYSLDNLSLMALTLSIGFLVDDAIVFLENVVRRMQRYDEGPIAASINGAKEISFTIISMTLSLAAVFLPLAFMSGLVGRIFREFAIVIIVAIIASGLVSLSLTPLMTARLIARRGAGSRKTLLERTFGYFEEKVLKIYGNSLWFFIKHKWVSAVIFLACLFGTYHFFNILPKAFLPKGDSGFIFGMMIAQEGASPEQMRQYQSVGDDILQKNEAVQTTFTMTGASNFIPSNYGLMIAFLKPTDQRPPIDAVAGQLMGAVSGRIPGAMAFLQPQPVLEISTGAQARQQGDFAYNISGLDPDQVFSTSQAMFMKLMQWDGFSSVSSDLYTHTPNLKIDILRPQASLYNVSATRIEALLRNAYSQNFAYLIKKPDDQYQVIVEVKDSARRHAEDLDKLYVRSDDGQNLIPLKAVATWSPITGPQSVNHTNQFTSATLFFNLKPGYTIGQATDQIEAAAKEVVPLSLRGQFQGEALTFKETVSTLIILMGMAVFVMYVILGILYESFIHPITVLSTLPTALVGGLATLWIFNEVASLYAFIGLFMLMGIVKKNGIMIVDFAVHRVNQGMSAADAIHEASIDRFRPIIMTTLAAIMGALPIALGYGEDGGGRRPLGLVIVGGLIVAQLITLYVTPVIYLLMELLQEKILSKWPAARGEDAPAERDVVPVAQVAAGFSGGNGGGNGDNH